MFISLITDFGLRDPFVGIVKAVIASRAPGAKVIDISHEVTPQDVEEAGFLWAQAVPFFPDGTVHVGVVDPGVGGDREILAVRTSRAVFLAPDNGMLNHVVAPGEAREAVFVRESRYFLSPQSATFHARDIFAPVAAELVQGLSLQVLGPSAADWEPRPPSGSSRCPRDGVPGDQVEGHIRDVDRFGNCVTDILLASGDVVERVECGGHVLVGLVRTYRDVPVGERAALVSSAGFLEIVVNCGRADRELGLARGDRVLVLLRTER